MASVEPGIGKRLHAIQGLVLVFPKTARVVSKRGRNFGSREEHFLYGAPLLGKIRRVHGSTSIELLTTAARLGKKSRFSSYDCAATESTSMISIRRLAIR